MYPGFTSQSQQMPFFTPMGQAFTPQSQQMQMPYFTPMCQTFTPQCPQFSPYNNSNMNMNMSAPPQYGQTPQYPPMVAVNPNQVNQAANNLINKIAENQKKLDMENELKRLREEKEKLQQERLLNEIKNQKEMQNELLRANRDILLSQQNNNVSNNNINFYSFN